MSASMAEVIRLELRKGSYQIPGDTLPYETQAAKIAEQLAANGYGKLGLEGGIWTMTDAEFKNELASERAKALEDAADELAAQRDATNHDLTPEDGESVRDHNDGRFLGKTVAVRILRARAATEREQG